MNIAFFTDSYRPYLSGVVKSIDSFRKELERQGHSVYIFAPDYPFVGRQKGIYRFISLPTPSQKDFRLAIPISNRIIPELKGLNLDIIHTHTPFLMGKLARHTANRLKLPLVFTFHTLYDQYVHYVPIFGELARNFIIKYVNDYCQSCGLIIAPSRYVEKKLKDFDIKSLILTVPTGIDLEFYIKRNRKLLLEEIKRELRIADFAAKLVYVGRLGVEKNLAFLLRSFNIIVKKYKLNACLIIVGEGSERGILERYCQTEGIDSQVIFTGKQSPEQVAAYYQLSDLFVFPSRTETQGLVTIEAMASGLPVVAVNAAGTRDMVDDKVNGILVEENEDQFANAVFNLLTDRSLYDKMSIKALTKADSLSIEKMTYRLLDGYQELISRKNMSAISN